MQGTSRTRIAGVALLTIVTALLVAGGAAHGRLNAYLTATVSKHPDGPFSTGPGHATVGTKARSFYIRAESTSPGAMQVKLTDGSFASRASDYRIRWYRGKHEITQAAHSTDGYVFKLAAGSKKVFRAKVKPRVNHPHALCLEGDFAELHPGSATAFGAFYINSETICGT